MGCAAVEALWVDDQPHLAREGADRLTRSGISAVSAESGEEAIKIAENTGVEVAVVDLRMPNMDGVQTAKALQERRKDLGIVFYSAKGSAGDRDRASDLQHVTWIEKDLETGDPIADAARVVKEEVNKRQTSRVIRLLDSRLMAAADAANLSPEQIATLAQGLDFASILVPVGTSVPSNANRTEQAKPAPLPFGELLIVLTQYVELIAADYSDPAVRDVYWAKLRELIQERLWSAASEAGASRYARQLAVQLKQAVRRISAPQLTRDHLRIVSLSLERLRSPNVTESDVAECKREWRATEVETLPSFERVLREWPDLYAAEGPQD